MEVKPAYAGKFPMPTFNTKNMVDIICNHKKCGVKKKYAIDFASTQLRIIRLRKYPIDPKAYLELCNNLRNINSFTCDLILPPTNFGCIRNALGYKDWHQILIIGVHGAWEMLAL